jgi:hypothetical protein
MNRLKFYLDPSNSNKLFIMIDGNVVMAEKEKDGSYTCSAIKVLKQFLGLREDPWELREEDFLAARKERMQDAVFAPINNGFQEFIPSVGALKQVEAK